MNCKTDIENTFHAGHEAFASELRKLSCDPAITKQPDPNFAIRFRDPDELGEEETAEFVHTPVTQTRRTAEPITEWCGRRSPKE